MTSENNNNNNGRRIDYWDQLRKNWFIIVFIGAVIMAWSNIQNEIADNKDEIDTMKLNVAALGVQVDTTKSQIAEVSGDIKEIKTSIEFIKESLSSLAQ